MTSPGKKYIPPTNSLNFNDVKIRSETSKAFIFGYDPPIDLVVEVICENIDKQDADIIVTPTQNVVITETKNITKFQYVFHTVAPDTGKNKYHQSVLCELLKKTYLNALLATNQVNARSIAIPFIDSTNGNSIAVSGALFDAIQNYIRIRDNNNSKISIKCIKIVNDDMLIYRSIVDAFKSKIDELQKELFGQIVFRSRSLLVYEYDLLNLNIQIYEGNLAEQEVDVIVNAANRALYLGGGVAGSIKDKVGPSIQMECNKHLSSRRLRALSDGDVMHTNSFMDNCKYVIHAVGPNIIHYYNNEAKCYQILEKTFYNALMYAEEKLQATSIAIPLISSGIFGVPVEVCCEKLYNAIENYIQFARKLANRSLKSISIVNIDEKVNTDIIIYFERKLMFKDGLIDIPQSFNETNISGKRDEPAGLPPNEVLDTGNKNYEKQGLDEQDKPKTKVCSMCEQNKFLSLRLVCGCDYCEECEEFYNCDKKCECKSIKKMKQSQ